VLAEQSYGAPDAAHVKVAAGLIAVVTTNCTGRRVAENSCCRPLDARHHSWCSLFVL